MPENDFHIEFNAKKTVNAVLFVVSKINRKDFHKIFKILYFSDRDHLAKYGRPITGDSYIAMDDGPVPSKLYDIFKSVRGDGYFKDSDNFSKYFIVEKWDLIHPKEEPNLKSLSKTDIELLEKNIGIYGDMSWDEVREKSHDYAWRATVKNRVISFENLFTEAGVEDSFIHYVKEQSIIQQAFR